MTTIIGYVEPATGKTWVGWDSRVTDGHGSIYHIEHEKVRQFGRWWIGCSGSAASLDVIEQSRGVTHETDAPHEVARLIQQAFCAADFKKCDQHAGPPCYEQELLLVRHGEIWHVGGNGGVHLCAPSFWAIGSGADFALGAACALTDGFERECRGQRLVSAALQASARFDTGTGGVLTVREVCER